MKGVSTTNSRNKFLLCFRPVVDMDVMLESRNRSLTYIAAAADHHEKPPAAESGNGCSTDSQEPAPCPQKRTFSKVVRAVLFEIVLSKRVREKKGFRSSKRSNSMNSQGSSSSDGSDDKTEDLEIQETKPKTMFSSSSSSSSSPELKKKSSQSEHSAEKQSSFNSGVFLFLISLTITVLWGRVCAILFTSIWLYFLPRGIAGGEQRRTAAGKLRKAKSTGDYGNYYGGRKRVIMEGLLERNHRRAEH